MLVVAGILLMVLLANLFVMKKFLTFSRGYYAALIAVLVVLYLVPGDFVLSFSFAGRGSLDAAGDSTAGLLRRTDLFHHL